MSGWGLLYPLTLRGTPAASESVLGYSAGLPACLFQSRLDWAVNLLSQLYTSSIMNVMLNYIEKDVSAEFHP